MRPSESLFWLPTGWLRPNFVAVRLDETENRTQQPGYPGDVGRKNAWARRVMGGDSILTIGRLCMANLLVMVVAAGGIHSSWAVSPSRKNRPHRSNGKQKSRSSSTTTSG
jgi:hypothetical protein